MESLRDRFRTRAAEDLEVMSAALDRADLVLLRERSHRLAGVAGTFGYPDIGEAARALEEAIDRHDSTEGVGAAALRLFALLSVAGSSQK